MGLKQKPPSIEVPEANIKKYLKWLKKPDGVRYLMEFWDREDDYILELPIIKEEIEIEIKNAKAFARFIDFAASHFRQNVKTTWSKHEVVEEIYKIGIKEIIRELLDND